MVSRFLLCGDGRVVARGQVEGWLRYFAHPLDSGACRGHVQYPAFAPGSSKVAVGGFGLFWSRICPNYTWMQLFLVPYSFFVFCCWRRGVSRCKHCSKGFQVCLNITANFNQILLQILINRFFMIWHLGCLHPYYSEINLFIQCSESGKQIKPKHHLFLARDNFRNSFVILKMYFTQASFSSLKYQAQCQVHRSPCK